MYILLGCGLWLCPARGQEPVGIPDAYTGTPDSLAFYIDSHYAGDAAKLEALYRWITSKMSYNVYPMFTSVNERLTEEEEVCRTLRAREGVCRHFAQVFCMVGERMDIPAFKVDGYVKSRRRGDARTPLLVCGTGRRPVVQLRPYLRYGLRVQPPFRLGPQR